MVGGQVGVLLDCFLYDIILYLCFLRWFVYLFLLYICYSYERIAFDRIFGFEYTVMDPVAFWGQIPDHLMAVYTLINVGVTQLANSKFNPLTLLHQIATPQDYVIVKLDIDSPNIENDLMASITASDTNLVDELFYEHHVETPPMHSCWSTEGDLPLKMSDSYAMFYKLREKGVRAHSWP